MGQLGMGVMLGFLGGNKETVETLQAAIGKKIAALSLKDDALHFAFDDGSKMVMSDDGQSCCEHRYMTTDDDLQAFVGATLTGIELRDVETRGAEDDVHEVQFLKVNTSLGTFTMASHNEHNGYYGGFWIIAKPEK